MSQITLIHPLILNHSGIPEIDINLSWDMSF
jgi:hypothetical protein